MTINNKYLKVVIILLLVLSSVISLTTDLPYFRFGWYVLQVLFLWAAADFITGVIHWWEDTYGNPNWPIIGKYVVEPNMIHHRQPTKLLEGTWWQRVDTSCYASAAIGGILWLLGFHSWQMIVCLIFCSQGNQVHAISHRSDIANGKWIMFLQNIGLLQSRKTHRWHHKAPYETNFCVMGEFVNPVLNYICFWENVEWILFKVFNIRVLRGSKIRGGL